MEKHLPWMHLENSSQTVITFNDITITKRMAINGIGDKWMQEGCEEPVDLTDWDAIVPKMDVSRA